MSKQLQGSFIRNPACIQGDGCAERPHRPHRTLQTAQVLGSKAKRVVEKLSAHKLRAIVIAWPSHLGQRSQQKVGGAFWKYCHTASPCGVSCMLRRNSKPASCSALVLKSSDQPSTFTYYYVSLEGFGPVGSSQRCMLDPKDWPEPENSKILFRKSPCDGMLRVPHPDLTGGLVLVQEITESHFAPLVERPIV